MTNTRDLLDNKDFWSNMCLIKEDKGSEGICELCEENKINIHHEDLGGICEECFDEHYFCDVCSIWYSKDDPCYFH